MSWATGRRALVISILVAIVIALIAVLSIPFFIHAPTCFDNRENGDETGIDCGGSCTNLCSASESPATVQFVRALSPVPGRTDVIAYIDNPNADAYARGARVTVELYDQSHTLLASHETVIDLPPASTVPLFIPNFYTGPASTTQAFITFASGSPVWLRAHSRPVVPSATNAQFENTLTAPRVTGELVNPAAHVLYGTKVIAVIYDAQNTVIGASQTVVPELTSQGSAPLTFTWNTPFESTPVRAELRTVPTLANEP